MTHAAADRPARARRWIGRGLALALAILLIVALTLVLARRWVAREALTGWLESRGVAAQAEVERIDLDGFVGRLQVGPGAAPRLVVERAEVDYAVTGPWAGRPFGLEVARVRLTRPILRLRIGEEGLSFGELDPLIDEFRARPPRPDARKPEILIQDGIAHVASDYGSGQVRLDARVADGKLMRLSARAAPARLTSGDTRLDLRSGRLELVTRGDRVDLALRADADSLATAGVALEDARFTLAGQAPYPDLEARRGDGRLALEARLAAVSAKSQTVVAEGLAADLRFDGAVEGWIDTLRADGPAQLRVTADAARTGDVRYDRLDLQARTSDFAWRRTGGDRVSAPLAVEAQVAQLAREDLRFAPARLDLEGEVAIGAPRWDVELAGRVVGQGAWPVLGPRRADDLVEIAALKRALADFDLEAAAIRVAREGDAVVVRLERPAVISADSGARAQIAPAGSGPLFGGAGGAFRLTLAGGGLPELSGTIHRYRLGGAGVTADADLALEGSLGPVVGADLDVAGRLTISGDGVALSSDRCAPFAIARLELGANDVDDLSGRLCPGDAPMLTVGGGGWRLRGRAEGTSAEVPFLQAAFSDVEGAVDLGQDRDLFARLAAERAQVRDLADPQRFHPLRASAEAQLREQRWRGDVQIFDAAGRRLGGAGLAHDMDSGLGGLDLDTGDLRFTAEGLQPADVSPLSAVVASPAEGTARFTGEFAWTPDQVESRGRLSVARLDFESPAGPVKGLTGEVAFDSLAPLVTAPEQRLSAARIENLAELEAPQLRFELTPDLFRVLGGEMRMGGGVVRLEPFEAPLDGGAFEGAIVVEGVQLSEVVEASPFAERVDLAARVSGRLPFVLGEKGLTLIDGRLEAIEPGRLSILRGALTGVEAEGGPAVADPAAEAPPNAAVEFAYQAMENLDFSELSATVNSLPAGRLGVLFRILGEHAPPERQEIRLTVAELIARDFLNRELPLPSGTKVDLTLDTTLNLDQLLGDIAEARRARASSQVQANPAP